MIWVGILMIMLSGGGCGYYLSRKVTQDLITITFLRDSIVSFVNELKYTKEPLECLFQKLGKRYENPVGEIWNTMSSQIKKEGDLDKIWKMQIDTIVQFHAMSKECKEVLKDMGKYFGHLDIEAQISQIQFVIETLNNEINQLSENEPKQRKMYQSMGFLCAAFVVILVI